MLPISKRLHKVVAVLFFLFLNTAGQAKELINVNILLPELALEIVEKTLKACRKSGFQVSVVVVDRSGIPQALVRDVYASQFTLQIAQRKANAVILSGVSTAEFRVNRKNIMNEINQVEGILVLDGALPITAAGSVIGAIGVSGAPGGKQDEACAHAGLQDIQDRLDFTD
ncbi:MAG: heme-binding protein [Gammaproteobacteria bacterium]|nr:heme-binding protein [Gammaproteobacteria bacterium]